MLHFCLLSLLQFHNLENKNKSSVCPELSISMMKTFLKSYSLFLKSWIISFDSKHLLYHKRIIKKRIIKILIYLSRNTTPHWHTNQAVSTELPPFKTQWTDLFLMRYLGTILWSFVDPHDVKTANCCRQMTSFSSSLHWWFLLPVRTRLAPFVYHQSAKHNIHMYNAWKKIISHVK